MIHGNNAISKAIQHRLVGKTREGFFRALHNIGRVKPKPAKGALERLTYLAGMATLEKG